MKTVLGALVIIFLGFCVFIALSGVSYILVITLHVFTWWHIALGTVAGTVIVIVQLLYGGDK